MSVRFRAILGICSAGRMSATIQIESTRVGPGEPSFVIAEIAQAHDGSLGTAHAYIDAVADADASAVKFQTHIAQAESTPGEPWRIQFSKQDATRYEYWQRMEFTPEQWRDLAAHARDRGLVFLSTPFSFEALELLDHIGVGAWKVGSGEVTNLPMLRRMARTGKPVILSSGLSTWSELDAAVEAVKDEGAPVAVMQCTTSYPCPPERIGLNVIPEMKERYRCAVGLSDHSAAIYAGLAATALGADLLEVHVVWSRACFGPDTSSSLTMEELAELCRGARYIREASKHPVDKSRLSDDLRELQVVFGKSVVAARDLEAGREIALEDLALKKPATGIPAARLEELVGRRLSRPLERDAQVLEADLE